jgi:DNA (cytosine-5)-methyltransferase 1
MAGRRAGTDDPRHLWPWMRDAIRVLRPRWALLENVPGHLGLGFAEVLADLAALGFDAEWELLPAAAFGAPHLRYRLFVVAHADGQSEPGRPVDAFTRPGFMVPDPCRGQLRDEPVSVFGCQRPPWAGDDGETRLMAHADDTGRGERRGTQPTPPQFGAAQYGGEDVADADSERRDWRPGVFGEGRRPESADRGPMGDADCSSENSHAETGRPWSTTGEPGWWAAEPDVGRVAHGVPARVDRLRCLGNAVVPQVAEWVGRRILEAVG